MALEQLDNNKQKEEMRRKLNLYLTPHIKINSKWIHTQM